MDEMTIFKKAFNPVYILQKENPDLAATLKIGFVNKSYLYAEGFVAGVEQYRKKCKNKLKNFSILNARDKLLKNKNPLKKKETSNS